VACFLAERGEGGDRAADRFPLAHITLDPNGGWLLKDAVEICRGLTDVLAYAEDGRSQVDFGTRGDVRFKAVTGLPTATNMIATDWRRWGTPSDKVLWTSCSQDPHFWTMNGSVSRATVPCVGAPGDRTPTTIRRIACHVHPCRCGSLGNVTAITIDLAGRTTNHQGADDDFDGYLTPQSPAWVLS
jgi:hypothetical protein